MQLDELQTVDTLESRLEVNFLKYPFFVLTRKPMRRMLRDTIDDRASQVGFADDETGQAWWVNPSAVYGYPGPFDKKVFVTVQQLVIEQGLPRQQQLLPVGSLRELCKRMRLSESGKNKKLVKEALLRIAGAEIYTQNTFYLRDQADYWTESRQVGGHFHIWDVFWKGERLPTGTTAECIYLYLNPPFVLSLNAFYLKPIDFDYYWGLQSPVAQRLYELLGLRFYGLRHSPYAKYRYSELCTMLPLGRQRYLSKAKQNLDGAHRELASTGFLAAVEWHPIAGERDWTMLYYPGERAQAEIALARAKSERAAIAQRASADYTDEEIAMADALAEQILGVTGDEHSRGFYTRIARRAMRDGRLYNVVDRVLGEVKEDALDGRIRTTKGAVFTDRLKRHCAERGIDLGLSSG